MSKYVSRRQPPKTCPHCKVEFALVGYAKHVRNCVCNPAIYAVQRAALDDGNGHIRPMEMYQRARQRWGGVLGKNALVAQVGGGWGDVAEFFGLKPRDKTLTRAQVQARNAQAQAEAQQAAAASLSEEDARAQADAAADAAEWDAAQAARLPSGLPVARVVVEERVYAGGDGWGVRVREERYELR